MMVRIDDSTKASLDTLAAATGMPRTHIVAIAVAKYAAKLRGEKKVAS